MARVAAYKPENAKEVADAWDIFKKENANANVTSFTAWAEKEGLKLPNGKPYSSAQLRSILDKAGKELPKRGKSDAPAAEKPKKAPKASVQAAPAWKELFGDFVRATEEPKADPNAEKLSMLAGELAEFTKARAELAAYLDAADRKIVRWQHRISLLRDGGIDPGPENDSPELKAKEAAENAEAAEAHEEPSEAPSEPKKERNAKAHKK